MININIILISGKSNSGKTCVSQIIEESLKSKNRNVIRCSLSTYIREITKNDFFWDGVDTLESRKFMAEVYRVGTEFYPYHMARRVWERDILPYANEYSVVIVESFREKVNYDFFKIILDECEIIDDIITVRVVRPNFNVIQDEEMESHVSESDLDDFIFDYTIVNDTTIDKLENRIKNTIVRYM